MITYSEYLILNSTLRPTIRKPDAYYVDPRQWLTWQRVIELLQDSGYLEYELTEGLGYKVNVFMASIAIREYRIAQTYKPSDVFEQYIQNNLTLFD